MRVLFCVMLMFTGAVLKLSLAKRSTREPVDCTEMDDHLLCGSDGITYLNLCDFHQAHLRNPTLKIEEKSGCPCPPEDKFDWDPICATNNELYANNCEFHRARNYDRFLRIRYLGLCKEFLESDDILYRDLQKIIKWKSFMPRILFEEFASRPLRDGDVTVNVTNKGEHKNKLKEEEEENENKDNKEEKEEKKAKKRKRKRKKRKKKRISYI